jgi:hypothetical protein
MTLLAKVQNPETGNKRKGSQGSKTESASFNKKTHIDKHHVVIAIGR